MQAKAIVFISKNQVEIETFHLRKLEADEVLVQTEYSCVSPGTELRCLRGLEKNATKFPFIPGYSLAGTVIETGNKAVIKTGAKVFSLGTVDAGELGIAWGGHLSHAICRMKDIVPVPSDVSMKEASITAIAAIAFHGTRLSRPMAGEKVAVLGLGIIGQLSLQLHALSCEKAIGCDVSEKRVEIAKQAGHQAVVLNENLSNTFSLLLPNGADIVVDSTGVPKVVSQAIGIIKEIPWDNSLTQGGRLLVQGSYENHIEIPYHAVFNKEVTVLFPRANQQRDQIDVLNLMKQKRLHVSSLVANVVAPENAAKCYENLQNPNCSELTYVLKWA